MSNEGEDLPKLTCSVCKNLLSIYPIYAYKVGNTFAFICGRCPLKQGKTLHRQVAYESAAQEKLFPCRFFTEGCTRNLCPEDLQEHEKYCERRPCICPSFPLKSCKWTGNYTELYGHYLSEHASLVLDDASEVDLTLRFKIENNYLWPNEGDLFLVYLKNSSFAISYYIACFMSSGYNEREKVYPISIKDFHDFNFQPNFKIKKTNQTYVLKLKKTLDAVVKEEIEIPKLPEMHETMLGRIRCWICTEFLRPPITNCATGHSFCESCAVESTECPICQEPTPWGRNFALENCLKIIIYPCRNRKFGCPVTMCLREIETHEKNDCLFKFLSCPFNGCSWKNMETKFVEHVRNHHQDYCMKPLVFSASSQHLHQGIIYYDGNLFYVMYKYDRSMFYSRARLLGSSRNSKDYEFEFHIRDLCKDDETLVLKQKCTSPEEYRSFNYFSICLNKNYIDKVELFIRIVKKDLI